MRIFRLPLVAASLLALSTVAVLAPAPSEAATPGAAERVFVSGVRAASRPAVDGTVVRTTFRLNNRTGERRPASKAWLFLVRADDKSFGLGSVGTPALAPGARTTVHARSAAVPRLRPGRYAVRVCLTPRPDGTCRTSEPDVRILPAALIATSDGDTSFESTVEMLSDDQDITFTNTGPSRTGRVTLTQTGPDAAEFIVFFSDCGPSLDPGQTCFADVGLLPAGPGEKSSGLRLDASRGATASIDLSGTAEYGDFYVDPGAADFGPVPVGQPASRTFDVVNTTAVDASVNGNFADNDQFSYDFGGPFTCLSLVVPANGSCSVTVTFAPTQVGPAQDTMLIYVNEVTLFIPVTGQGTPAAEIPVRPGRRTAHRF
ncbi:hypothetical protein BH11ACT8_BH11ACT8_09670 [soil metagenome]